jgi:hypothetical protein
VTDTNPNWPEDWQDDVVTWTPKYDGRADIDGFAFEVFAGVETTTPSVARSVFEERWADGAPSQATTATLYTPEDGDEIDGEEPARAEQEGTQDGDEQEAGGDAGAGAGSGDAGEPVTGDGAGD